MGDPIAYGFTDSFARPGRNITGSAQYGPESVAKTLDPKELEAAFSSMAQQRIEAIVVSTDTLFQADAVKIAELAARQRLPSAGGKAFAVAGGLIGYGPDDAELYRRAAYFVDRIIKGAKPADLPIEQATKFDL